MKRRTLLTAVAGVVIAGCSTATPSTGPDDDAAENRSASDEAGDSDDDRPSDETLLEAFEMGLEDRGFEGVTVEEADDEVELRYDATGTTDDDVAAEIELITDGYTTAIESGVSATSLDATAYDPDDDVLDSFTIETEWVEAYLEADLEWRELLTRIAETFESDSPAEDEDDTDDETAGDDGDDDSDDGDDDDSDDGDDDSDGDGNDSDGD